MYWNLQAHPQILSCFVKEANSFDRPGFSGDGLDWFRYRALFPLRPLAWLLAQISGKRVISFETTPGLFASEKGIDLLKKRYPDAKIIFTMRNPIERAYSGFMNGRKSGNYQGTFDDHIRKYSHFYKVNKEKILQFPEFNGESALRMSLYAPFVQKFLDIYGEKNCLFIRFENYKENFFPTHVRMCEFMGIQPCMKQNFMPIIASRRPGISADTVQSLNELFAPYNAALISLLGPDFQWDTDFSGGQDDAADDKFVSIPPGQMPAAWSGDWVDISRIGRISDFKKILG